MFRLCFPSVLLVLVSGCGLIPGGGGSDIEVDENPLPEFIDDCGDGENDEFDDLSGLEADDGESYDEIALCEDDRDYYRIDVPANSWVQVELTMDGGGQGNGDLDLWEIEDPENPVDERLDMASGEEGDDNVLWYSATEQDYERLAWYNSTDEDVSHFLVVDGYQGGHDDYNLDIRVEDFHDGLDCDDFFDDSSEGGPCNEIMQFPQAQTADDGYVVSHETHYSNLRREVAYLVRYAAAETAAQFEDTNPLGLGDMSEDDGDTPGRMRGQLRHPEGTHVNGNDLDLAYYQTGDDNLLRSVCADDNYFCTSDPNILDARRTAFFMAKLMESPNLRVIGVDTKIAPKIKAAAQDLRDEGILGFSEVNRLDSYMAYGEGWPFHQHHMHFSWDWEDGWEGRSQQQIDGCEFALGDHKPAKVRIEPGR